MTTFLKTVAALVVAAGVGLVAAPASKAEDLRVSTVAPYGTESYTVNVRAGELALGVKGSGDTVLVIRVYNDLGELIAKEINTGGVSTVLITSPRRGKVFVDVTNTGRFSNRFAITVVD